MSRRNLSPVDIAGITLGVIVILVVIGSVALLARGRAFFDETWRGPDMSGFWDGTSGATESSKATREEKDERFTGDISAVVVRTIAGAIEVHGGDSDAVVVHSVRTAVFPKAMERVRVSFERSGGRLVVEEKHDGGFMRSAGSVSLTITVPRGVKSIEAHSVSGSVTLDGLQPGVEQKLSTVSGSISTNRTGDLDASSTSGSITFGFAGRDLEARTVSGSIQGRVESLARDGSIRMNTVSGAVAMDAFAALDATVSLHSLSGGVSCEFPLSPLAVSDQKRNALEGRIGRGDARVEVTTTSGPITIRKM